MKAVLEIQVENPKNVMQSLLPDIKKDDKDVKINIKTKDKFLVIIIEANKINHLKAAINSYLSLINTIKEME